MVGVKLFQANRLFVRYLKIIKQLLLIKVFSLHRVELANKLYINL